MSNPRASSMRRFTWYLVAAIGRHDIASLGAVITFYLFFSLFPFILLIIYIASVVVPQTNVEHLLTALLGPYFPALKDTQEVIDRQISDLAAVGQRVGMFSAITLTWSAMSGFLAVQQAMDVIWEGQQRSYIARRLVSFFMVMVLLIIMLFTALVTAVYPLLNENISGSMNWLPLSWLHGWSRVLFPLSLFITFVIFYRYLPSQRSPWESVVPGALVATLLLDAGRTIFVWYAGHLVRYQMVYGGLAAVMLLVFWMYVGSIIMLFGAEVSAALHHTYEIED